MLICLRLSPVAGAASGIYLHAAVEEECGGMKKMSRANAGELKLQPKNGGRSV